MFNFPSFGIGFLGGFIAGFVSRELTTAARPIAKGAIRSSLSMIDRSREALAQMGESFDDLVAEARAELSSRGEAAEAVVASAHGEGKVSEKRAGAAGHGSGQKVAAGGGKKG